MTQSSLVSSQKMHFISKTPFSKLMTHYQKYQSELQDNTYYLTKRFPLQSSSKIKQLLQEFNNNIQMVQEILLQASPKIEDVNNPQLSQKKMSVNQQNTLLKRSYLNLFRKLKEKQQKLKQAQQKNEKLTGQNEYLKSQNKYLRQSQILNYQFEKNLDIF